MKKEPFLFKIRTPLWTGDIDSKSDLLQSTGVIGSLRWWTEAVLRGINKFACDPVGDDKCPKERRDGNKKVNQYCPACLIFLLKRPYLIMKRHYGIMIVFSKHWMV